MDVLRPLLRSMDWRSLGFSVASSIVVLTAIRWATPRPPVGLVPVLAAAVVAAAAVAVADPAAAFLRATPTLPLRRWGTRIGAAIVAGAVGTGAVLASGSALFGDAWSAPPGGSLAAFAMCIAAATVVTIARAGGASLDAVAVAGLTWAAAGLLVPEVGLDPRLGAPWAVWPGVVSALAGLALASAAIGVHRRH